MTIFNFDFHNGSENQLLRRLPLILHIWPGAHFTNHLWGPQLNSCGIYFCSNFDSDDPTRSQICTCHNSWAVVTCAKLWSAHFIIFHVREYLYQKDLEYELINCLLNVIQFCPWLILLPVGWISLIECGRTVQFLIREVVIRELWKLFEDCWQGFLVLTWFWRS